jgi:type VI secretion system protein ImpA
MASASEVVDVEALLAPIPGDNPAGENLQYAGLHDEIREARRSEDDLAQGDWQREIKVADWDLTIDLSEKALATRTKDLQVGAWLTEALVRKNGFPGLRDGLKVMRGLHERFWDRVYPEVEEGDLEGRANSLSWLDRQSAAAIKEVPLTKAPGMAYSYIQLEDSKRLDLPPNPASLDSEALQRLNDDRARASEQGKATPEDFAKAKAATARAFYEETAARLSECWQEFQLLDKVMDEKFGRETPGLGELKKTLDVVRDFVERTVKEKRLSEPDASELAASGGGEEPGAGASAGAPGTTSGPIRSRQDALTRLAQVADYFRRTEPHSPISYIVQRAIAWGQMPLDAWLADVIKDSGMLASIKETLGLKSAAGTTEG